MIRDKDRERQRLHQLFSSMPIEPTVSYKDIVDGVRRVAPPETVWGLARDIHTHLEAEPDSLFSPDHQRVIRRGMADRWVHSALGEGDARSAREEAVVAFWEGMNFAGIPPLRSTPLHQFSQRHERVEDSVYPLGVYGEANASVVE